MKRELVLMRGLPGSGKSTEARMLCNEHLMSGGQTMVICSTDNFHMEGDKYVFKPDRLNEFHIKNQFFAQEFMLLGVELVVIDNTNIKRRDMLPYIDAAEECGYEIDEVIIGEDYLVPGDEMTQQLIDGYIKLCATRNTHGVPLEVIERMARKFEL